MDDQMTEVVVVGGLFRHGRPGTARRTAKPGDTIMVADHDLKPGLDVGRLRRADEPEAGPYDELLAGTVGDVVAHIDANPDEADAIVAAEVARAEAAGVDPRKGITGS